MNMTPIYSAHVITANLDKPVISCHYLLYSVCTGEEKTGTGVRRKTGTGVRFFEKSRVRARDSGWDPGKKKGPAPKD